MIIDMFVQNEISFYFVAFFLVPQCMCLEKSVSVFSICIEESIYLYITIDTYTNYVPPYWAYI